MKKLALLFVGALLCNSCFLIEQGRIADGMCRPKHPKFKLLKAPFKETDKLTYNRVYINQYLVGFGIGFYPDGRLMYFYSKDGIIGKTKCAKKIRYGFQFLAGKNRSKITKFKHSLKMI